MADTDSTTLPQFVFPANQTGSYTFNYIDFVNVSWSWDSPPDGASVGLELWVIGNGQTAYGQRLSDAYVEMAANSWNISTLNSPDIPYPAKAHYQLVANWTTSGGYSVQTNAPNSVEFTISDHSGVSPMCNNCTNPDFAARSTSAPTTASSTSHASSPATTVTLTTTQLPQPLSSNSGLSGGAIAGIVIGLLAAFGIANALVWLLYLRKKSERRGQKEQRQVEEFLSPSREKDTSKQPSANKTRLGTEL
ncbi:hypothetical protein MMC10_004470 [Thelotrema lepadinum]|nr:hypothetical protein [Thelotrema lepadinum]